MFAGTTCSVAPTHQSWEFERQQAGGVVVGIDGSKESIAALNSAAVIARHRSIPLHAVTVLSPYPTSEVSAIGEARENASTLRLSIRDSELGHIVKMLEPAPDWTHEVVMGRPAHELVSVADRRGSELIVVGRKRHGAFDRALNGENTLQVMRKSAIPVLAVDSDLEVPRTVVAAIDFSPSSRRAARIALDMMGQSGTLYLVCVEPPAELFPKGLPVAAEARYPGDMVVWFRRLIDGLGSHHGVRVEPVVLNGRPMSAIVQFAERVGADLIAAGSHGHGRLERLLLGSVSTGLVRNANCAVLVAPAN